MPSRRHVDAGLSLLDRHVVDTDGVSVGKVDDLELAVPDDGRRPTVAALLLGPQAQGPRIGGHIGRWMAGATAAIAGPDPHRIPFDLVDELGVSIRLRVPVSSLPHLRRLEHWLRDSFIGRIPGGRGASG